MDNLSYSIAGIDIDVSTLVRNLESLGIPVSRKTIPKRKDELITFSLPIGKFRCRWMFRCSLKNRTIACSGGVTKTFFGHNVWVFKNEFDQLSAIIEIIAKDLKRIEGIALPTSLKAITVERIETTRHHELGTLFTKRQAIDCLSAMFMAMFPNRHFRNGATHNEPGTTGIGLNKSSRVCRVYDPIFKFKEKPDHVPDEVWNSLRQECDGQLRVELMFGKRELHAASLDKLEAWKDSILVEKLVEKRYEDYGLSVAFNTKILKPEDVTATNPAYVEAARFFFTNEEKGAQIDSRNGTSSRFKRYMAEKGYCTDVLFSHHGHLAHGLHDVLKPQLAAELPQILRKERSLFNYWWK